jgi:hypothetical protein
MANLSFLARAAMCLAALLLVTDPSAAASKKPKPRNALAECRAKHGDTAYEASLDKNGQLLCRVRSSQPSTDEYEQAVRYCKSKHGPSVGATARYIRGEWYCIRYE